MLDFPVFYLFCRTLHRLSIFPGYLWLRELGFTFFLGFAPGPLPGGRDRVSRAAPHLGHFLNLPSADHYSLCWVVN